MGEIAVSVAAVSGSFLKIDMPKDDDDDVTVVFEGKMVDLLIMTDAPYENKVRMKCLYVRLTNLCMGVSELQDCSMTIWLVNLKILDSLLIDMTCASQTR